MLIMCGLNDFPLFDIDLNLFHIGLKVIVIPLVQKKIDNW